jgi:phosphopantetheine adenylyltransferase
MNAAFPDEAVATAELVATVEPLINRATLLHEYIEQHHANTDKFMSRLNYDLGLTIEDANEAQADLLGVAIARGKAVDAKVQP